MTVYWKKIIKLCYISLPDFKRIRLRVSEERLKEYTSFVVRLLELAWDDPLHCNNQPLNLNINHTWWSRWSWFIHGSSSILKLKLYIVGLQVTNIKVLQMCKARGNFTLYALSKNFLRISHSPPIFLGFNLWHSLCASCSLNTKTQTSSPTSKEWYQRCLSTTLLYLA